MIIERQKRGRCIGISDIQPSPPSRYTCCTAYSGLIEPGKKRGAASTGDTNVIADRLLNDKMHGRRQLSAKEGVGSGYAHSEIEKPTQLTSFFF